MFCCACSSRRNFVVQVERSIVFAKYFFITAMNSGVTVHKGI